ncbi:MAG: nucleotidyltransferase domain-containing protein [Phaeodactylibacter sp.]|nr:nucleotidyltransferase domain-containing protein [Phaeodactylibacter sp.]
MTQDIQTQLQALEQERRIKILLAVESGSRAWGFPSPNSDYDVRFFYLHDQDWYLSITDRKDTIEYFHNEWLDFGGWDIRKALSLVRKSNGSPAEWLQSPTIYREVPGFRESLFGLVQDYFQPVHSLNHYRGIALNSLKQAEATGQLPIKKVFYMIRPLLAALWIAEHQTVPPMQIGPLLEQLSDEPLQNEILELIERKKLAVEAQAWEPSERIQAFIEAAFAQVEATKLEKRPVPDAEPLNQYFRSLLQ